MTRSILTSNPKWLALSCVLALLRLASCANPMALDRAKQAYEKLNWPDKDAIQARIRQFADPLIGSCACGDPNIALTGLDCSRPPASATEKVTTRDIVSLLSVEHGATLGGFDSSERVKLIVDSLGGILAREPDSAALMRDFRSLQQPSGSGARRRATAARATQLVDLYNVYIESSCSQLLDELRAATVFEGSQEADAELARELLKTAAASAELLESIKSYLFCAKFDTERFFVRQAIETYRHGSARA